MCRLSRFSLVPTLCDPMDCSPLGSSVHGILQAKILEWVAVPSSRGSSQSRWNLCLLPLSVLAGGLFTTSTSTHWVFYRIPLI